ncbi:putative encoded peptide [Helianthus annuus]|nr:putative encoded peptide [Helianthus annuus]
MTNFKIYTCLIVLVIVGHATLEIEGRQLKSMKKQDVSHSKVDQQGSRNAVVLQDSPANGVPHVAKKQTADQSQGYGWSKQESINDLRPTAPGNSPGAGHRSFTEHIVDTQGSGPSTKPGPSPGGGHKPNQIAKPNA